MHYMTFVMRMTDEVEGKPEEWQKILNMHAKNDWRLFTVTQIQVPTVGVRKGAPSKWPEFEPAMLFVLEMESGVKQDI